MGRADVKLLLGKKDISSSSRGLFCNDHFDYIGSCCRLFLFDCGRVAAERKERRPSRGFRRSGQPDSVWSAGRGFGSFPSDDLVRNHLHAHVDHAVDFCSATNGAIVRAFGSEADADEVSARDSGRAVRTADRSAKPSADTEIEQVSGPRCQVSGLGSRLRNITPGMDSLPFLLLWWFGGRGPE